ncbi:MAG: NUDIX hydrolase [Planktomarina sp.]
MTDQPIRPAATVIIVRDLAHDPKVLMGQRGAKAAFMPNKFVFPGGAVDHDDHTIPLARPLSDICDTRLCLNGGDIPSKALAVAAIREVWEETGLIFGTRAIWNDPPGDWRPFANAGFRPTADALHFFFRAITPPGRSRRFDARFFLADAMALANDPDDFSAASDELSHLQWVRISDVRTLNLPFITSVVMGEVAALTKIGPPPTVPFFDNTDEESLFRRLGGDMN